MPIYSTLKHSRRYAIPRNPRAQIENWSLDRMHIQSRIYCHNRLKNTLLDKLINEANKKLYFYALTEYI